MGHPLLMLAMFFAQFHQITLERDMIALYHHAPVPSLRADLGRSPLAGSILHHHYWTAVRMIASGCCDNYYKKGH